MESGEGSGAGLRRILRLASDCDPTTLTLSAEEGFLLSRIDGHTPWRLLREIGGMGPEEADLCLEGWLASGFVFVDGVAPEPPKANWRATPKLEYSGPKVVDESLIEEGLDIDAQCQLRILEFETRLELPYHELLGVSRDASEKEVKRAYFGLSKEFHPDRYFRRNIAGFEARLLRIFKRVLEAYEITSDPELREGLEQSTGSAPASGAGAEASSAEAASPPPAARPLSKLERLRQRMPFKIPHHILEERSQKASGLFSAAQQSKRMGRFAEAISGVRIAISFDPYNAGYKAELAELKANAAESLATEIINQSSGCDSMTMGEMADALKSLEDVLMYRPHDPLLNHRAAALALELEDIERASEYANVAVKHSPDVGSFHTMLGKVYCAKGNSGHARREFESAIKLDPDDVEARKGLASLRLGRSAET